MKQDYFGLILCQEMEKQLPVSSLNLEPGRFFRSPVNSPAHLSPLKSFWRKLNIPELYRGKRLAMIIVHWIKFRKLMNTSQIYFGQIVLKTASCRNNLNGAVYRVMGPVVSQSPCHIVFGSLLLPVFPSVLSCDRLLHLIEMSFYTVQFKRCLIPGFLKNHEGFLIFTLKI